MVAHVRPFRAPRVSVLIPTFNYGRFLWQAIESVLAQDFTDIEVIISDDGSTDNSAELIAEFSRRDARIRSQVQPANLGMVENWNWCLRQARGEYVKFLFSDDCLVEHDALSQFVAALDAAPSAALAASARLLIDEAGRPLTVCNDFGWTGRHDGLSVLRRCMREHRNFVGEPSAVMFRREVAARGFDPSLRQVVDQEFWFHLLLRGDFVYLPTPLCAFRVHGEQQTQANRKLDLGPAENMVVTERYIHAVSNPLAGGFAHHERRAVLYHALHYSQKHARRTPPVVAAELAVRNQLGTPWYVALRLWHRLTKPARNLLRFLRRRTYASAHAYTDFDRISRIVAERQGCAKAAELPDASPGAPSPFRRTQRAASISVRHQLSPTARIPGGPAKLAV